MAYATANELKTYLGITGSGDDTLFGELLDRATAEIEQFTGRQFAVASDTTRYFDAIGSHIGGGVLYLPGDLCSITTVTNGDDTEVNSDEYTTLPRNATPYYAIRLLSQSGVTWTYSSEWMDAISITGRWGYSTTPPDDIVHACVRLAAFYYRQKDAQLADVTAIEAGTVIRTPAMPAEVKQVLTRYVRH